MLAIFNLAPKPRYLSSFFSAVYGIRDTGPGVWISQVTGFTYDVGVVVEGDIRIR